MQTAFSPEQLASPAFAASEAVIRKCVHCGFCTATCPTYVLLGDELDSPRGRIYLMKHMLESGAAPSAEVVTHIDRCLSCLSCMTTCPSGVNYMHLVDHARAYVEEHYHRPLAERLVRALLAATLPYPARFRLALRLARLARPLAGTFDRLGPLRSLGAMLRLAPVRLPALPRVSAGAAAKGRVVLQRGCVEPSLRPEIAEATARLLARAGYAVDYAEQEGCCGALVHHLGREEQARSQACAVIDSWIARLDAGAEAIIVTASGCGTVIKDYGFLLREDPAWAAKAARIAAATRDLSEFLLEKGLPVTVSGRGGLAVAWHAPCSLQHGQKLGAAPVQLLQQAGFEVRIPAEAHLCCGSAGTYNILQPGIAGQLAARKAGTIAALEADCVVTANIGCAVQIGAALGAPVLHLAELLDWASGGPMPAALAGARR